MPGESQGSRFPLFCLYLAQNGNERLGKCAFSEKPAKEVGQPKGDKKGVCLAPRAKIGCGERFSGQARDPGEQGQATNGGYGLEKIHDRRYSLGLFTEYQGNYKHMANSASARKSARQAATRRLINAGLRSSYRTAVKSVRKAVAAGDATAASAAFRSASSVIDRIADKKIVHKNKASRHKSRLAAAVKTLAAR